MCFIKDFTVSGGSKGRLPSKPVKGLTWKDHWQLPLTRERRVLINNYSFGIGIFSHIAVLSAP